jgi:hypothetical protein
MMRGEGRLISKLVQIRIFCRIFAACGCMIVNATMLGHDDLQ